MHSFLFATHLILLTADDPLAELEAKALQQRQAVRLIDIVYTTMESDLNESRALTALMHTWVDGDQSRCDRTVTDGPPGQALNSARSIRCRNCERKGWGIDATDLPDFAAVFAPLSDKNFSGPSLAIVDPRVLGYSPELYVATRDNRLDQAVGAGGRSDVRSRPEAVNGVECVRIDSRGPGEFRDTVWIAPELGHTILKIRRESLLNPADPMVWTVVSSGVKVVGKSGLFYPDKISWELASASGKVSHRNEMKVQSVSINEPILAQTFKLGGLGLPDGFYVSVPERGKSGDFHNGVIETPKRAKRRPSAGPVGPPVAVDANGIPVASNGWIWAVAAAVLALLAVGVAVYRLRSARRN